MFAEIVDYIAQGKRDFLKVWKQAFDFVRWQSGQQPVLTEIHGARRSSHT
jgi:hypothetical protein